MDIVKRADAINHHDLLSIRDFICKKALDNINF